MNENIHLVINSFGTPFHDDFFPDNSLTVNNIPDISLTCFKFPDISRSSRQVLTLYISTHLIWIGHEVEINTGGQVMWQPRASATNGTDAAYDP